MRVADGRVNMTDRHIMDERLRAFVQEKQSQETVNFKAKQAVRYLANSEYMQAVDHGLQGGVGLSLGHFVVARKLVALAPDQARLYIPAEQLPEEVARLGGFDTRSVVVNRSSGERFLECVWGLGRMCLFGSLDCGAIGFYSKFWLYSSDGAGLRGCFFGDPCHTRYNRFKTAVREAGLWPAW